MDKRSWTRGAVALMVLGGLVATLVASPVGAAITKKKVKKTATKVVNSLAPGIATSTVNQLAPGIASSAVDAYSGGNEGIFASTKEGPTSVPDTLTTIHSLVVPPGSYALFANVTIVDSNHIVTSCQLEAGGDINQGSVNLLEGDAALDASATVSLQVAHTFSAPGTAELKCGDGTQGDNYDFVSLIGVRAPTLTR